MNQLKKFFLKHPNVIPSPDSIGVEGSRAHARIQLDKVVSPLHIYWSPSEQLKRFTRRSFSGGGPRRLLASLLAITLLVTGFRYYFSFKL